MNKLLLILCVLLLVSCNKEVIVPSEIKDKYIKQEIQDAGRWSINGNIYYYANSFNTNYSNTVALMNQWNNTITFSPNCIYTTVDPDNQQDWIKLFGCKKSPFPWNNHKNGGYLVWSWDPDDEVIRVSWYLHDRDGSFICGNQNTGIAVAIGEPIYVRISNYKDHFNFQIGNTIYIKYKSFHNIDDFKNANRLNCYGGGTETIPHQRNVYCN